MHPMDGETEEMRRRDRVAYSTQMVVIKKPHSDDVLAVFLKEAKLLPGVKHENIVQLAVNDEPVSIVMEYVLRIFVSAF